MRVSPTAGQQVDEHPATRQVTRVLEDRPVPSPWPRPRPKPTPPPRRRTVFERVTGLLAGPVVQGIAVVLGLVGSVSVAITALAAGPLSTDTSYDWWFTLPTSWLAKYPDGAPVLNWAFYTGLGLVSAAWLLLGLGVRAGRWRIRQLWLVALVWSIPLLLGPVALSTDVYTYLGQGLVYDNGFDPYTNGPFVGGLPALLAQRIPSVWINQPSPYGPGFTGIDALIAPLSRSNVTLAVIVLRLTSAAGLVLAALCLPRMARTAGGDPVVATWLGVTSPLAMGAIVLSGHNDALMVGLVVAALALATVRHPLAPLGAVALAACATMMKAPALVAVGVIAVMWMLQADRLRTRLARIGAAALVTAAMGTVVSLATGLGTRWLNLEAISSPRLAAPTFTPVSTITQVTMNICNALGFAPDTGVVTNDVQLAGMCLVGLLGIVLLIRLPRVGSARAVGMLMAAVVVASPVTWPWYFTWPVLLLGGVVRGRWLRTLLVLFAGGALFLTMADGSPHDFELTGNYVVTGLVALAVGMTGWWIGSKVYRRGAAPAPALPAHV